MGKVLYLLCTLVGTVVTVSAMSPPVVQVLHLLSYSLPGWCCVCCCIPGGKINLLLVGRGCGAIAPLGGRVGVDVKKRSEGQLQLFSLHKKGTAANWSGHDRA